MSWLIVSNAFWRSIRIIPVTKPSSKPFKILSFKKERHAKLDFTDQNIRQRGNLIELNFEGLEIQKRNVPTDIIQIVDE